MNKFLIQPAAILCLFAAACTSPVTSSLQPSPGPSTPAPSVATCGLYASATANAGSLEIKVLKQDGAPAGAVRMVISRNYTGVTCPSADQVSTNGNGERLLTNLIPGNYTINLMNTSPPVYKSVDITANATATVVLTQPS